MMRVSHPVYSEDLSPCDFGFFGNAKELGKDRIITSDDDLEDKLTGVWAIVSGELFEPMFHEWISRVDWVIERKRE
jgi:hypothetical protein